MLLDKERGKALKEGADAPLKHPYNGMLLDEERGKALKEGLTPLLNTLITGCSLIRRGGRL